MTVELMLQVVLGTLAVYHLGMGMVSVAAPARAGTLASLLYALDIRETAALRYTIRMLGLYALALGALLCIAVRDPGASIPLIVVVAGLQLARAVARVALRRELAQAFRLPSGRNALNAGLLVLESALLLGGAAAIR